MSDKPAGKTPFHELVGAVEPLKGEISLLLKRAPEITPGTLERRRAAELPDQEES